MLHNLDISLGETPKFVVWTGQGLMKRAFVFSPKQSSLREWGLSVSCQPRVKEKLKLLICSWSAIKVIVWGVSVLCLGFFALSLFDICLIGGKGTSSFKTHGKCSWFMLWRVQFVGQITGALWGGLKWHCCEMFMLMNSSSNRSCS